MALVIYLALFVLSLCGIAMLFMRRYLPVKALNFQELELRLRTSHSLRKELRERWVEPLKAKCYEVYLPRFWRWSEKIVRRFRVVVLKFETQLKRLSDNLRGKHVNLEVPEKSEYWQTLNGAKENAKNNFRDVHKSEEEHQKSLPVKKNAENNAHPPL